MIVNLPNEKQTPIVEMANIAFLYLCLCIQMCVTPLYDDKMEGFKGRTYNENTT